MLWLLGAVATHQTCIKCGQELSRQHGIQCSGVLQDLVPILGRARMTHEERVLGATAIDAYIGDLSYIKEQDQLPRIAAVAKAIERIRTECGGYKPIFDASSATAEEEIMFVLGDNARPDAPPRTAAEIQADTELRQVVQRNYQAMQYVHVPRANVGGGRGARQAIFGPPARERGRGRGRGQRAAIPAPGRGRGAAQARNRQPPVRGRGRGRGA
jgi:hypothetical protein